MKLLEARKIWDNAPHNAFTDLIRFKDRWYCAFREGRTHVSDDGKLRVIRSGDGREWSSVAIMEWDYGDVRDAKLSITANGELMLNGAVRFLKPVEGNKFQSVTWLSADGERWSEPFSCPTGLDTWRWSVTWHKGTAYSFGYSGKDKQGCLYRSKDGKTWEVVKDNVYPDAETYGNETSLVFLEDDTAYCLLRRDKGCRSGMLGVSHPPHTEWKWSDLGTQIGGPKMIPFGKNRFLAAVRLADGGTRTSLCWIDPQSPKLTEALKLPSGGDTSYAGLVLNEGLLWVSYYSSHEGKTAIYLAKVEITSHQGGIMDDRVLEIGNRLEPFWDTALIGQLDGARLTLHAPRPEEVLLRFEKPWEGRFSGYCTVLQDGARYRLYYRGWPGGPHANACTCLAESDDGIHFQRPMLGLCELAGCTDNNAILAGAAGTANFAPFIDTNPDCHPDCRYKAIARAGADDTDGMFAYASPDGVHWRKLAEEPVLTDPPFDSHNVAFWSQRAGCYECYVRHWMPPYAEPGNPIRGIRGIARRTSPDFLHWSDRTAMEYGDAPSEELYTNATQPYFRAPHLYLALPKRYVPGVCPLSEQEVSNLQVSPNMLSAVSEAVFMTSRAPHRYDRTFMEAMIRPGLDRRNWIARTNLPAWGVVPTGEAEMSMYVTEHYTQPTYGLRRYSLRTDGFASLQAGYAGGEAITRTLRFAGSALTLNVSTSAAGSVRVEVQDADGQPLPGRSLADADILRGDAIERVVSWGGSSDLSEWAGRPVRLHFELKDADLYSFQFTTAETQRQQQRA